MSSGNRKTYDPQRLLVNPADKLNLKRDDEYVALSNLTIYYKWKNNKKSHTKTINLKYQGQHGIKFLNYLMDHILY